MINVPQCCIDKPYGFHDFVIENLSTKIPMCEKHFYDYTHNNDKDSHVSIHGCVLEDDEKIDGVTNLKLKMNLNFVEKILDIITRIDNAHEKIDEWQEDINMYSRDLYKLIKENKDKIKKC